MLSNLWNRIIAFLTYEEERFAETVDELLSDVHSTLTKLETFGKDKVEEAEAFLEQSKTAKELSDLAQAEADKATRIAGKISDLLK